MNTRQVLAINHGKNDAYLLVTTQVIF